jgi:elongator complex protein 1
LQVDIINDIILPSAAHFPSLCLDYQIVETATSLASAPNDPMFLSPRFVGSTASGKLYLSENASLNAVVLATNVTSFIITPTYVVYTSTAHEARFLPTAALLSSSGNLGPHISFETQEKRRIERGSRIVVAIPSAMNLLLQMPRGNLETISPRPFVLEVVKSDVSK